MRFVVKKHILVFLLLFFGLCYQSVLCQGQNLPLIFRNFTSEDGLQNNNIYSLFQDHQGFIWIGTENGLHRFDGINFTLFEHDPAIKSSISGNVIFKILEDAEHKLYFCTNAGFEQFNPDNNSFIHIPGKHTSGLLNHGLYIPAGLVDRNNNIYISGGAEGIFKLNRDSAFFEKITFHNLNGMETDLGIVTSLFEDQQGNLWMGSKSKGVFSANLQSGITTHYSLTLETLSSDNVYVVFEDSKGNLLVGTDHGLNLLDTLSQRFTPISTSANGRLQSIYVMAGDREGNVWLGTNGEGLIRIDHQTKSRQYYQTDSKNPYALNSNFIRVIYEDRQGNLWIGTQQGGLNCHLKNNRSMFRSFRKNDSGNSLTYNSIDAIFEDRSGHFWLGTDGGGLNHYDPVKEKFTSLSHLLPMHSVLTVYIDQGNELWAGGYLEGLYRLNRSTNTVTRYVHNHNDSSSLGHDDVRSILEDSKGNFWIATNGGGLNKMDRKTNTFQHYFAGKGNIASNFCTTLFEDSKKRLWLGTYSGFSILDQNGAVVKTHKASVENGLSGNWIYCFHEDSKGRYWIGTDYGLNLFEESSGKFTSFLKKDGLPNNVIAGILEDANGFLWISTNGGLAKFDPENKRITNFNNKDGIPGNHFNHGAFCQSKSGKLLFGSTNGLLSFHPDRITLNQQAPPVYITDLALADTSLVVPASALATIQLDYKEASFLNFRFSALNFINAEKNQYQYFLEGFDKNWSAISTRQSATYTNLSPGTYIFHVRGSNNDGIWNQQGARVVLTIVPPFYRTLWAYLFYVLVAAGLLYFFIRYALIKAMHRRELEIEKVKREKTEELATLKTNFFTNISHELSTPLSLILAPLQQMRETASYDQRLLEISWNNARRLQNLVKELLEIHKIEEGKEKLLLTKTELHSFASSITENFQALFDKKEIALNLELKIPLKEIYLDKDKTEKILGNLLSNAFKYTPDRGSVNIRVSETPPENFSINSKLKSALFFSVSDNGIGIGEDKLPHLFDKYYRAYDSSKENMLTHTTGYGIGLYYTKTLIDLHQGEIHVQSIPGKGSTFLLVLPDDLNPAVDPFDNKSRTSNYKEPQPPDSYTIPEETDETGTLHESPTTVLIVEDNTELNEVLSGIFKDQFHVLHAFNGIEGWKLICRHHPDVIITDIMMPKMDGIELCEKVKKDFDTCHIPVVMLTALNTDEYKLKGIALGADDYVTKPFNPKILSTRVNALVESRRMLQKKFLHDLKVSPREITVSSTDELFLKDAIQAVEKYMENPEFDMDQFCKEMTMSESGLYRKLKAITSQSPNQFIRTIRLKRAAQLLENTGLSVSEVCYQVGFSDVKYFRKCFQKQFGTNPGTFNTKED